MLDFFPLIILQPPKPINDRHKPIHCVYTNIRTNMYNDVPTTLYSSVHLNNNINNLKIN